MKPTSKTKSTVDTKAPRDHAAKIVSLEGKGPICKHPDLCKPKVISPGKDNFDRITVGSYSSMYYVLSRK